MAAPRPVDNPCDLDPTSSPAPPIGAQSKEAITLFEQIIRSATDVMKNNEKIKNEFLNDTFGDPSFITSFDDISYDWLPQIPPLPEEKSLVIDDDFIKDVVARSFEYLLHFAVAMEQVTLDQMVIGGHFYGEFRNIETRLTMALCNLQLANHRLGNEKPNVNRDVMTEEYRAPGPTTVLIVRNYIILRDHSLALKYIISVFEKIVEQIDKQGR